MCNGPPPTIHSLKSEGEEATLVGNWKAVAASASPTAFPQHALLKLSAAKKPPSVAVAAGPDTERLDCVESV